jgi:hypothetical protein
MGTAFAALDHLKPPAGEGGELPRQARFRARKRGGGANFEMRRYTG